MNKFKLLATLTVISLSLFIWYKVFHMQKCELIRQRLRVQSITTAKNFFTECMDTTQDVRCLKELDSLIEFLTSLDAVDLNNEGCEK